MLPKTPDFTLADLPLNGNYDIPRCAPELTNGIVGIARLGDLVIVSYSPREDRINPTSQLIFLSASGKLAPPPIRLEGSLSCAAGVGWDRFAVATSDGMLYVYDAPLATPTRGYPCRIRAGFTRVEAPPLIVSSAPDIFVGTLGGVGKPDDGLVVSLGALGRPNWPHLDGSSVHVGGQVSGFVIDGDVIFVAARHNNPPNGLVSAFRSRDGSRVWPEAFRLASSPNGPVRRCVGAPLTQDGRVLVGSSDGHIYVLDAATGKCVDRSPYLNGIIDSAPIWHEFNPKKGFVIARTIVPRASTPAKEAASEKLALPPETSLHAWQPGSPTVAWTRDSGMSIAPWVGPSRELDESGDACLTMAGAASGVDPFKLPWHGGDLAWGAERMEQAGRWEESGRMWQRLGKSDLAAAAYEAAANVARNHAAKEKAAILFRRASDSYSDIKGWAKANECAEHAALCARLPLLQPEPINTSFVMFKPAQLTLRLTNRGAGHHSPSFVLLLAGDVSEPVLSSLSGRSIAEGEQASVRFELVPNREIQELWIELVCDTGNEALGAIRTRHHFTIHAKPQPTPINIDSLGAMTINMASGDTAEGFHLTVHDIGFLKALGGIGSVTAHMIGLVRDARVVPPSGGASPQGRA